MGKVHNYFNMLTSYIIPHACWLEVAELEDVVS